MLQIIKFQVVDIDSDNLMGPTQHDFIIFHDFGGMWHNWHDFS